MIHGPNGSGKSTFLRLLRGDVWPVPRRGERLCRVNGATRLTAAQVRHHIALIPPAPQGCFPQRNGVIRGRDVIQSGFAQTDMLYARLSTAQRRQVEELAGELQIVALLERSMQ